LTVVGSVSSVFGGLRFFWSAAMDYTGSFKKPYFVLLCIQIVFGFTFVLTNHYKAMFFIWVCVIIFCEGGHFTLVPTACAKMFGEHAPLVFGFAFSFGSVSQIISSVLVTFLLDKIGFGPFYYASGALSVLALVVLIFFFEEKKFC